jgi:tRNA-specific 2-thiouridylase
MFAIKKEKSKVIVAMSGGVDSSVAAVLLKRAGFDVVGVNMKLNNFSSTAEKRARKVAKILKIPFYVFNFKKEFKKRVIDSFLAEYQAGRTPNPCVVCNKEIKFGLLLEKSSALDTDFVATGHYVRKIQNPEFKIPKLLKGKDKEKDQSYFLWRLNQKQLKHILFPVGNYTKVEVRKLAKKFGLSVFDAPESQEVCFISERQRRNKVLAEGKVFIPDSINIFLRKYLKEKPGQIINKKGEVLGRHQGLWFYTIGQRKGIGLAGGPYFVSGKNLKKNFLIVTKNEKDLLKKELAVKNVNWLSGREPKLPIKIKTKIRYRHIPAAAKLYKIRDSKYGIRFNKSQRAVTPGQSVVFYNGQELLGGGIIC